MTETAPKDLGATDTGIKPNIAALLAYLLGFVTGIIFVLLEKKNKFVRFHAMQSIVAFGALIVLDLLITPIPVVGLVVKNLLALVWVILCTVLMVKAYQGEKFKLPLAGEVAEKYS